MYSDESLRMFQQWRGLDPDHDQICDRCGGSGKITYPSTSTWRGGIGGCAMTDDVCDKCWGSGDSAHPWPDRRKL